jgi:hypothetical protein
VSRLLFLFASSVVFAGLAQAQTAADEDSGSAPARGVILPYPVDRTTTQGAADPPAAPDATAAPDSTVEPPATPAQQPAEETDTRNAPIDKRVFGVLPNYRTANSSAEFMPLTVKQKFYIGYKDSVDYPVFPLAAAFAGLAQLMDQHARFGQGVVGFAHRYGTALADQDIGNFMTESIMPSLFHQDPRYFRRGYGSTWSRLGYAATRIFVAPTDSGRQTFNFGEVIGNATAAGIANAYYPGERKLSDNFQRLYTQLATDSFSQVLKEFWPDVKRWYVRKYRNHGG